MIVKEVKSPGPGFLKTSVNALKNVTEKLLQDEGMYVLAKNPVTADYLKLHRYACTGSA